MGGPKTSERQEAGFWTTRNLRGIVFVCGCLGHGALDFGFASTLCGFSESDPLKGKNTFCGGVNSNQDEDIQFVCVCVCVRGFEVFEGIRVGIPKQSIFRGWGGWGLQHKIGSKEHGLCIPVGQEAQLIHSSSPLSQQGNLTIGSVEVVASGIIKYFVCGASQRLPNLKLRNLSRT